MSVDEVHKIVTSDIASPQEARVKIDGHIKLAALLNRQRFGDKIELTHALTPDLLQAMRDGRARAGLPDDTQVIEQSTILLPDVTDSASVKPNAKPRVPVNIFD